MDSSLIDANASSNSVVDTHSLNMYPKKVYRELEQRLDKKEDEHSDDDGHGPYSYVNRRYLSTTDPEASIVSHGRKPNLYYKTHRSVDPLCEIITAVEVTPGAVNEAHRMTRLIEAHEETTGCAVATVVADSMYGTMEKYLALNKRGITAHTPLLKTHQTNTGRKAGIFPEEASIYDPVNDTMMCPGEKQLTKRTFHEHRQSTEYRASKKDCMNCTLRPQCTRSSSGSAVHRHLHKETLDAMLTRSRNPKAKQDIAVRKYLMEREALAIALIEPGGGDSGS